MLKVEDMICPVVDVIVAHSEFFIGKRLQYAPECFRTIPQRAETVSFGVRFDLDGIWENKCRVHLAERYDVHEFDSHLHLAANEV